MTETYARTTSAWRNWAGTVTARPARTESPASVDELADVLRRAHTDGLKVKPVGSGHSFTAAAAT
ncbi:FAD-binding protein, partial [Streptomyces sp. SID7982]|nr:FAD-binding protein [Streptomyces sp. SID7982]